MRLKLFVWILLWGYPHLSNGSTSIVNNEKGALVLNQPWKLVLHELLTFEEVTSDTTAVDVNVPGTWNGIMWKGEMFSGQGYGTYYIKLDLTKNTALRNSPLALEMADVGLAYRVYANTRLLGEVGQVGTSKEEAKPKLKTEVFYLPEVDTDQLYIIVHVSNYWHQSGGIWFAPKVGLIPTVTATRNRHNNITILVLGSVLIIGIYHLYLFLRRRKERYGLYFFGICTCLLAQSLSKGDIPLVSFFPSIEWSTVKR